MSYGIHAVIAHFDPHGERSVNLIRLLRCAKPLVDYGVVVSTGMTTRDGDLVRKLGFGLVQRANIGYDFMSYAVGLDAVLTAILPDQVLFCNDSMFITRESVFQACLLKLLGAKDQAAFLLSSGQAEEHGQSFCFKLRRRLYMRRQFREFFASVRPQPTRLDVVFQYEIGLSRCIQNFGQRCVGVLDDIDGQARASNLNAAHTYAAEIEALSGFVKYERLMKNPLDLPNSARLMMLRSEAQSEASSHRMAPGPSPSRAIAVCHCHYVEVIDDLVEALDLLPDHTELHLTSANEAVIDTFATLWRRRLIRLHVHAVENHGRDVLPFLELIWKLDPADNIPVLKVHGKRSLYSPLGTRWRRDLIASLLPSEAGASEVLNAFRRNPRMGMLGPAGSYTCNPEYWGGNREQTASLIRRSMQKEIIDEELGFFAGTMFWIRAKCVREILPFVDPDDFEQEAGQRDGTFAHVLERAIPMFARLSGWDLYEVDSDRPVEPCAARQRTVAYF